jgi:hypothetical protein
MTDDTSDGSRSIDPSMSPLTNDERAAVRAYLQRSEVRLSTMHRIASALLSGAGIMVLLPAVERDSVTTVLRALLADGLHPSGLLLVAGISASIALPFTALWMVLRDLTQFYFHANHLSGPMGEVFVPRFTLTGLKLPSDELSPSAAATLAASRDQRRNVELLVPSNDDARHAIDRRIAAYGGLGLGADPLDDRARAVGLLELAASKPRELLDEVAKVEYGMARHVLRTQVIVLRYVKALLALLTTAFAAFIASAVVEDAAQRRPGGGLGAGQEVWLAGILIVWAPVVILAVSSPVRWLDRLLRSEGASSTAITDDRELTKVEDVTGRLALVGYLTGVGAMATTLISGTLTPTTRVGGIVVLVAGSVVIFGVVRHWSHGDLRRRLAAHR